ncbi:MAG: hypothetical protein JWR67_1109 [Mucilaginibacter sp.]|nr:hypothetical protein [Mucilaginibacter sp.]
MGRKSYKIAILWTSKMLIPCKTFPGLLKKYILALFKNDRIMKVLLSVLLMLLSIIVKGEKSTDSLLNVLKSEISQKNLYDKQKDQRIKLLKQTLAEVPKKNYGVKYTLYDKLYEEYRDYVFDSAYVYTQKLLLTSKLMHDLPKQHESQIKLGLIQVTWGMFKESFDCIRQTDVKLIHDSVKFRYYEMKSRAYMNLARYNSNKFYSYDNSKESIKALDSALLLAKPGSYEKYKFLAESLTIAGQPGKASIYYQKLLNNKNLTDHQKAMIAIDLSNLIEGPKKNELIMLAAIYDIRSSTKETLAVFTLGKMLFEQGNLADAELLLKEALSQAQFYGNRLHAIEIVAILTTLSGQKIIKAESKKNQVLTFLIVILVMAIVGTAIISLIVYNRLQKVKVRETIVREKNQYLDKINKNLLEDAHIKEEYIGYFFNIISGYILKLEKIKRNTERKIKTKNYEELLHLVNEIDIKQERHNLFYTFDNIFLKLFPNFITSFNALLKPEDQMWPKANEVLNTNLRIFALMRLGIKDNQTIANILENTVSTIYTYKNRIKSKALVHGDDFERKIMEIKFVDVEEVSELITNISY